MKYDVWSIPTTKGRKEFGWAPRKLNTVPLDKENADEMRYLSSVDAAPPDQAEYIRYVIRPVSLTDDDVRAIETIPVEAYISAERMAEFHSLIRSGYPASAVLSAIRETVYAMQKQMVIPPTSRE